ncbi:MAG: hypothetical protein H8E43_06890 [Planctomycetia bacterium]|nr:hypothetical protein [Planctomycetia bacterium]
MGIVAKQCDLLLLAKQREEAAVSEKQYKLKIELDKQRAVALELWKEAMAHHNRINPHKKTASDKWWKTDNAHRSNLHKAYQSLVDGSLSRNEKKNLYNCLGVLEEAHWHISNHDPVPWKEDFLVSWNKARLKEKEALSIIQDDLVFQNDVELLQKLTKVNIEGEIIRFHGDGRKINKGRTEIIQVLGAYQKENFVDYKSCLRVVVGSNLNYRVRSESGPDHAKKFVVQALLKKQVLGVGKGRTKKEAGQAAAKAALDKRGIDPRLYFRRLSSFFIGCFLPVSLLTKLIFPLFRSVVFSVLILISG